VTAQSSRSPAFGYAVVRNGDGTQMYLVPHETGHEQCTCPDFQHRQGRAQQPCKHLLVLVAQITAGSTQSLEYDIHDRNDKTETITRLMGRHSLALLNGDEDEADRLEAELARVGVAQRHAVKERWGGAGDDPPARTDGELTMVDTTITATLAEAMEALARDLAAELGDDAGTAALLDDLCTRLGILAPAIVQRALGEHPVPSA